MPAFDPKKERLKSYGPLEFGVECRRCGRNKFVSTIEMKARFGDVSLAQVAILLAGQGSPPCQLATDPKQIRCSATAVEVPVHWWAQLDHARQGKWNGFLICRRRFAALKATTSCPEVTVLDVMTLCSTLGGDFKLGRLPGRLRCPHCGTDMVDIEWQVPEPTTPGGTTEKDAVILRMRQPLGNDRFRVIDGEGKKRARRDV